MTRCAVCGLSEDEAVGVEKDLQDAVNDKAQLLGALFTCDGNCGNYFHPRCVGLQLPVTENEQSEGEWLCIDCAQVEQLEGSRVERDTEDISGISNSGFDSGSILARITEQYQVMRSERNRLMLNWQHERKLTALKAKKDELALKKRDEEYEGTVLKCKKLAELLSREQFEVSRLRRLNEEEIGNRNIYSQNNSSRIKLDASDANKQIIDNENPRYRDVEVTREEEVGLEKSVLNTAKENSTAIPKPWLPKRLSKYSQMSQSLTSLQGATDSQSLLLSSNDREESRFQIDQTKYLDMNTDGVINGHGVRSMESTTSGNSLKSPRRVHVSPIRPDSNSNNNNNNNNNNSKKEHVNRWEVTSPDTPSINQSDSLESNEFLFPLRNRLKDLIKTVELETGTFAQVRLRQKEREKERVLLRSSHSTRRSLNIPLDSNEGFSASAPLAPFGVNEYINNRDLLNSNDLSVDKRSLPREYRKSKRECNDSNKSVINATTDGSLLPKITQPNK